jgi:hypothetical protein
VVARGTLAGMTEIPAGNHAQAWSADLLRERIDGASGY